MISDEMVFEYLDELRDEGKINMFGAVPYIMQRFEIDDESFARGFLERWMDQFRESAK